MKRSIVLASRIQGDLDLKNSVVRGGATARIYSPGGKLLSFQGILAPAAVQNYQLGTQALIDDCIFRYIMAGGVDLAPGKLAQMPVPQANDSNLAVAAAAAVGDTTVTVTLGASAVTANQYAEGYLYINDGTGVGQRMRIKSHPAALATASLVVTLWDAVGTALDTSSKASLVANKYNGLIVHPSPPTAKLIGVPQVLIPAGEYGWAQTRGPAAVLTDGTLYISLGCTASDAVDGAVQHENLQVTTGSTAATDSTSGALVLNSAGSEETGARLMDSAISTTYDLGSIRQKVGSILRVNADTKYSLVDLVLE